MVHRLNDLPLELLRLHLMTGPEIETDNNPQQPPQRLGHQRDSLHPLGKPERRHHGRHEQAQCAKRQRRTGQAVHPVHKPIKVPLALDHEFLAQLLHRLHLNLRATAATGLGILAKDLDRLAHHVAAAPEEHAKHPFNQPHDATLC